MESRIAEMLRDSSRVKEELASDPEELGKIAKAAAVITEALRGGKKVLLFGNGGSAADAQHIACELTGRFKKERRGLPAIALTTNTSCLTAIANDYGYDMVFSRQVEAFASSGDVVIGISTSGNSKSVIDGVIKAREKGAFTIGLTGKGGGELAKHVDMCIRVPSNDTPRIQESHITIGHIISELVEGELFA
ncbi:MAG: D-sedoheptulose 7-phosphate isomerase [Conexivisphaerales archaeon]